MPTSIHEHPEDWLAASLADGLTGEERHLLDEHLAGCEHCRALQADLAALDAMLLRDFPVAAGPEAGFEQRLVAGFRHQYERGGGIARLRRLAGWLLQQRGMRAVAVASALLALVGVGQLLTSNGAFVPGRGAAKAIVNEGRIIDGVIAESAIQNNKEAAAARRIARAADVEVGRDISPSFFSAKDTMASSSMADNRRNGDLAGAGSITLDQNRPTFDGSKLTLGNANTYSGAIAVNGGVLSSEKASGYMKTLDMQATRSSANSDGVGGVIAGGYEASEEMSITAAPAVSATPAPDPRKLIRNARAELEVASFDAAVDAVAAAATQAGGFLDTRDAARGSNGKVGGTLVVKVLPDRLDAFLIRLRTLGDLKNQTLQTEDVTKAYYDTDARLRNSRRMEDRLLKMLDEVKGKMSEVLQVEKELGRVRADIEEMQGQLKLYDSQVQYATVTLSVYEKDLRQPAAFLLRETATLTLLAADVEKTAAEVRGLADAAHAQVVRSDVSRDPSGRSQATLRLLAAPDTSAELIAHVKTLGRVENFNVQDERTAQNGAPPETAGADSAKVERAPVTFDITITHDEQVSRQVSFTLVAGDVDGAFEKARGAASAVGGDVTTSNLVHAPDGHASATLGVRVPAAAEAGVVALLRTLGRAGETQIQRAADGAGKGDGPVLITVNLEDAEPAVQQTNVRVQTNDVERCAEEIKRDANAAGISVETSDFSSEGDGRQSAELGFRLPTSGYAAFVRQVRALGEVKDFTVRRQDRPGKVRGETDASAPVAVELSLYSEGHVVGESSGLGATLRRTMGQGAGALMWSVQMIGVALAFLAPWGVLVAALAGGAWWLRRRQTVRPETENLP